MTRVPEPWAEAWAAFVDPPDDARPRAWWHWMDGNVDPVGVERDLRWLHEVGVRGVQLFDGGMGVPLVVPSPVRPGSPEWDAAIAAALDTAAELGMEVAVATSAGWSAAGAEWVEPADSMKKVVWAETLVDGGRIDIPLPELPSTSGLFQDLPRWGVDDDPRWNASWRVLALPAHREHEPLHPDRAAGSAPVPDPGTLVDGCFATGAVLPRDPDGWSTAWIEQEFDEPVTVRSVVVGLPGPRGFGAAPAPDAVLQASDDGSDYRDVAVLPPSGVPVRSASFPPVTARLFRLVLSGGSAADALPPREPGVRLPPILRRTDTFTVSQFALREAGRVHHGETKAGFGVERDYYAVGTDPASEHALVEPADVVDVTAFADEGRLRWNAPPGSWRILHLGASSTGQTNGPAPADSTGLEVDKLDGARVGSYLTRYLARFGEAASGIGALLSDSIEAGPQNWTDRIAEQFAALRGYDPTPWLPCLAGLVVGSAEASDRFLYDYRRTLAELLAREYYGTLAAQAHARGWVYYAEALEDGRPQLGDDLAMRARADVPMGAMWAFDPSRGPRPTYVADLKGASSVAHVFGKARTGAEAFTSFERPWSATPAALKHIADLQLALGVTRFCVHTSPHQPEAVPPPGIALAPFLGQAFTRRETWAGMARPWIDYLSRCSALLALGAPAVDIAVFVGEEAPVTGLHDAALDTTVPPGYDFDYLGAEGLDLLRVAAGSLVVPGGALYRVLHLAGSSIRMTVPVLRRLAELHEEGATIVGPPPETSPSLADDPAEFARLRARIWDSESETAVATDDLAGALDALGIAPGVVLLGARVRTISRLVGGRRLTFLANPSADPVTVSFGTSAPGLDTWDPVLVRKRALPRAAGRLDVDVALPPFGSVFVIEAQYADAAAEESVHPLHAPEPWNLTMPGQQTRTLREGPRLWTEDAATLGFSGIGVYSASLAATGLPDDAGALWLDLGAVEGVAEVVVNGVDCGVAWTPPWRVDVTSAWRAGANEVEVRVATPWRNRLIAEASSPSGEMFAPMTAVFESEAAPMPAGCAGPVVLVVDP